jgi:hypothetical protein
VKKPLRYVVSVVKEVVSHDTLRLSVAEETAPEASEVVFATVQLGATTKGEVRVGKGVPSDRRHCVPIAASNRVVETVGTAPNVFPSPISMSALRNAPTFTSNVSVA